MPLCSLLPIPMNEYCKALYIHTRWFVSIAIGVSVVGVLIEYGPPFTFTLLYILSILTLLLVDILLF